MCGCVQKKIKEQMIFFSPVIAYAEIVLCAAVISASVAEKVPTVVPVNRY